jgi:phosphatidylglycerophosphatase A
MTARADRIAAAIATLGGLGRVKYAPGTVASLAALPVAWLLHWAGGIWALADATLILAIAGHWASGRYIATREDKDPPEVVVDEAVGMMIALWPLSGGLTAAGVEPHVFPWPGWVMGFLLFRAFDILKPPPVGWADRREGALGIMLDDIFAGLMAAFVVFIGAGVAHGWF